MPLRVPTHLSSADYWWTGPSWWLLGSKPRSSRKPWDAQFGIPAILNSILWCPWNCMVTAHPFFGGTNKRSELDLSSFAPKTIKDTSRCIPLRIYGDGADAQQHFEIFTLLPILGCSSSTLDSRILLTVRNTEKTAPEARRTILEIIAWSFEALRTLMKINLYLFSFYRGV